MKTIDQAVSEAAQAASIDMLTAERDRLTKQVELLSALVKEIPQIITSARLDAKQGIATKYDYARAKRALFPA